MGLTFDPYESDGSPRRFVGMFRAPFAELDPEEVRKHTWLWNPTIQSTERLRDDWLRGMFDRPLYVADEATLSS